MDAISEFGRTLSAPLHIEIAIASRCQLQCSYCSAAPFTGTLVDTEKVQILIRELGSLGVFSILLSGGEPTVHPDFLKILETAYNSIPDVTVNSNGIRLSHFDYASRLHAVAPNSTMAISIDAADVLVNNKHRGAGGAQAIRAVENLIKIRHPLCISTVMTEDNLQSAEKLIDIFYPDVKFFRFFPRMARTQSELKNNDHEYWAGVDDFFRRVGSRAAATPELRVILPYNEASASRQGSFFANNTNCCCSNTKSFIDSELKFYPCYYSANQDTCFGDFERSTFRKAWNNEVANSLRVRAKYQDLCGVSMIRPEVPHKYDIG